MNYSVLPKDVLNTLDNGVEIQALPLVLDKNRNLDGKHHQALIRYYLDSCAGGVEVDFNTPYF